MSSLGKSAFCGEINADKVKSGDIEADGVVVNTLLSVPSGTINANGLAVQGDFVDFNGLPTSSAGLDTGRLWNDAGTLKIVI